MIILKSIKYHWHIRFAHYGISMGNKKKGLLLNLRKFGLLTGIEDKRRGGGIKKGYL